MPQERNAGELGWHTYTPEGNEVCRGDMSMVQSKGNKVGIQMKEMNNRFSAEQKYVILFFFDVYLPTMPIIQEAIRCLRRLR